MLQRDEWFDLGRELDWDFSYVEQEKVFPEEVSGSPWLDYTSWSEWREPYQTTYGEYIHGQYKKNLALQGVRDSLGKVSHFQKLAGPWLSCLKLYSATFSLAEFAAVIGNLRVCRFGRTSSWRSVANLGALDEIRHTEIPLLIFHELIKWDAQFDWVHRFYHSNNWVAIASRHMVDELLLGSTALEFAIGCNFVFESGFTNLQFVALAALAEHTGDHMFEALGKSIQTDEARHAQMGPATLKILVQHDRSYAQYLLDKWFWRSWQLFAVVTGISMDYLTPLESRTHSFKEFMEEWILDQFTSMIEEFDLSLPWYWPEFLAALDHYHHMVYASAYTYRASVWFNMPLPSPRERLWLEKKYPRSWPSLAPIWEQITHRWQESDLSIDLAVHGTAIIGFCNLCQLPLCAGEPKRNTAKTLRHNDTNYIFCSAPCAWIFQQEKDRYDEHKDLVKRVLHGEAPANLMGMLIDYFGLDFQTWGKDSYGGHYPWLKRKKEAKIDRKKRIQM